MGSTLLFKSGSTTSVPYYTWIASPFKPSRRKFQQFVSSYCFMPPDFSIAQDLLPFCQGLFWPPGMILVWAPNSLVCSYSASRLCSATGTFWEVAITAYLFLRQRRSCILKKRLLLLSFWAFTTAWIVRSTAKGASEIICSLSAMRNELKSGVVKSFHLSGGLTQTAHYFQSKCLRWKTTEGKHSTSCSVASHTPADGVFDDAYIVVNAIPQKRAVRKAKEEHSRTT